MVKHDAAEPLGFCRTPPAPDDAQERLAPPQTVSAAAAEAAPFAPTVSLPAANGHRTAGACPTDSEDELEHSLCAPLTVSSPDPFAPLLRFYSLTAAAGSQPPPQPALSRIAPESLPSPYRQLLHHSRNMTARLSDFFSSPLHLQVLHAEHDVAASTCLRFVRLLTAEQRTVEFGCIAIAMDSLPKQLQPLILEGVVPFGRLLLDAGIDQVCRPRAFFALQPDDCVMRALGAASVPSADRPPLFGRCVVITDSSGSTVIARVVEILPYIAEADAEEQPVLEYSSTNGIAQVANSAARKSALN